VTEQGRKEQEGERRARKSETRKEQEQGCGSARLSERIQAQKKVRVGERGQRKDPSNANKGIRGGITRERVGGKEHGERRQGQGPREQDGGKEQGKGRREEQDPVRPGEQATVPERLAFGPYCRNEGLPYLLKQSMRGKKVMK
jgi:hypothetical protein